MSNYLFLNHQSPVKKNPLVAQGVISPNSHLLIRPTSSKAQKQQVSHNNNIQMYRNMQLQPQLWIDNMGYRAKNNNSPVRSNLQEEKVIPPQYNFQYLPPQKKDPARLSHTRIERTPQQIRISRDISPLARVNMANEGVDYPVRVVRMEDRGNKEGSWNKLLNRSQEQAMSRNQKLVDWRKVLEEQVREQTMKKQQEMERVRNQELEAENRYQRQIEELSGEIEKRKRSLHKNGVLRQEPHLYPLSNASPLNQLNSNVNNITSKSHKDLRLNKEVLGQVQSMTPMPTNIRERRTKNYQREENSAYLNYSAEKSRNETLNQYIDNLKAEIFQGQEVFKSHIKDLREEAYKLGKFRNVAERNLLRAQSIDPLRSAGVSSLPSHVIYRDINELEDMANASINLVESHKPSKPKPVMLPPDEDKLKWDTDDFFAKLPPVKELVTGAQTMVKIEPVTEQLLAYKKPSTPIKKKIEEDMKTLEMLEDNKRASKESIPEQSVMNKENKEVPVKPKFPSFKKIDVEMTMKENRLVTTPAKTAEEAKVIPSISSIPEARSTPKGGSKPGTQLSLGTPKNNEKPVPEDYLKIKKNFQPLTMMLNGPGHVGGTVTPSIETGSRREQILSMASRNEQTRETREIKEKLETLNLNTNEDVVEKEDQKMKKSTISEKELKKSLIREKLVKKSEGTLKVLSKFVAKDGLEAKMADNKKLQSDPLARLDFMIDYLFNYDVKGN